MSSAPVTSLRCLQCLCGLTLLLVHLAHLGPSWPLSSLSTLWLGLRLHPWNQRCFCPGFRCKVCFRLSMAAWHCDFEALNQTLVLSLFLGTGVSCDGHCCSIYSLVSFLSGVWNSGLGSWHYPWRIAHWTAPFLSITVKPTIATSSLSL